MMKKEYFEALKKKLFELRIVGYVREGTRKKITVRHGSKTICELSQWEINDLYVLWDNQKTWKVEDKK